MKTVTGSPMRPTVAIFALIFASAAIAQNTPSKVAATDIPRMANGKPDLNGVWERPYVPDMSRNAKNQKGTSPLPFTEWGAAMFKKYDPAKFDYTGHCLPQGLTRSMNSPFPIQIVQTPKTFAVLYEAWNVFHVTPTDGRTFPKEVDPTWMGTSFGHWDGDTLIVETRFFNDRTNLDTVGHPHSDQMKVIESYQRTDATHISYEVTIDDPKTYTMPWKNTRIFTLRPDWNIMEYSCEENNKDFSEGHIR
ncbi:MAG TPA: hypothetical protein VKV17_10195 [Bryobacteraceae bacterium]|nr:hypothetical protein [Bryobacteraceae bacterium]